MVVPFFRLNSISGRRSVQMMRMVDIVEEMEVVCIVAWYLVSGGA